MTSLQILHILTASLAHAQPVLAAAINAGFRESGVQSLRNLDDPEACPMVAVRTSGLALESIVGFVQEDDHEDEMMVTSLVSDDVLRMLVELANERFVANAERKERFQREVAKAFKRRPRHGQHGGDWETQEDRRDRKRAEGLEKQHRGRTTKGSTSGASDETSDATGGRTILSLDALP